MHNHNHHSSSSSNRENIKPAPAVATSTLLHGDMLREINEKRALKKTNCYTPNGTNLRKSVLQSNAEGEGVQRQLLAQFRRVNAKP